MRLPLEANIHTMSSIADLIYCPFCGGDFELRGPGCLVEYDILECQCGQYPIVAGIPILKKRNLDARGQRIEEVIRLIGRGQPRDALLVVLMPEPPSSITTAPASVDALTKWKSRFEALLTTPVGTIAAYDFIDSYFRQSGQGVTEGCNYFLYRFGQPRHLVPLSLATVVPEHATAILDLGCGLGQITRRLTALPAEPCVVGVDEDFFGLYVAKHWIAPGAQYVCCAGDTSLPFRDDAVSAAFCTDAFQSFTNKLACIRELRRVVSDDGVIVLSSLRNRLVKASPYSWMSPLPPDGYETLFADMPHRLVPDSEIIARYLQKLGPSLAQAATTNPMPDAPWLSLVASHNQDVFRDYGSFADWPHAEGRLSLNPLYVEDTSDGMVNGCLRRVFPSHWYQEENAIHEHTEYLPEKVSIDRATLMNLTGRTRSPEVEELLKQCVVIGLPERYLPLDFSRVAEDASRGRKTVGGMFYIEQIGVSDLAAALIPAEDTFIVVDEGLWQGEAIKGRRGLPFLERDGKYWGKPQDDETAIRELERLRQSGANFILFGSPALWWLDYYSGFSRYLHTNFRCVLQNENLTVFDLRS